MPDKPIKGIIVPLVTPLESDSLLDTQALRKLVRHCLDGGIHGLFPAGTSGLGPLLPLKVWIELMETVLNEAGDPDVIMAGAIAPSTVLALERVRILEKIGFRRFVVTTPFYIRPKNDEEYRRHFLTLANATSMEMVIYNIPPCTGTSIPETIVHELSRLGATKDCKDSSGDIAQFESLCHQSAGSGLRMYMGMKPNFIRLHEIGAYGCVPIPANVFPSLFSTAWNSPSAGTQTEVDEIWSIFVKNNDFISATVHALSLIGIGKEHNLSPYTGPVEGVKTDVKKAIDKYL